jgi:branched-chain amino acid aminotransferase
MIVMLNGEFRDEKAAHVSTADRGLTLGDGVFDTLLCIDGKLQYAKEHFLRLLGHAGVLRLYPSHTPQSLEQSALTLLKKNRFLKGRYALRTTLTRGPGERGVTPPENPAPTLLMRASPLPDAPPPVHAIFAAGTRRNQFSPLSLIKSLSYGDNVLAMLEAQEKGANEAFILNAEGHVACATSGNVFALEEGRVLTPPLSDGVLDGITRAILMATLPVREQSLTPERLLSADGVYLTNSVWGIRPVEKLNGSDMPSRNAFYDELVRSVSLRPAA